MHTITNAYDVQIPDIAQIFLRDILLVEKCDSEMSSLDDR